MAQDLCSTYTKLSTLASMPSSTTLRVRTDTRDRLNALAREVGVSTTELLDRLVAREEAARLLTRMNEDFARLRGDEAAWADFQAETEAWDAASPEP